MTPTMAKFASQLASTSAAIVSSAREVHHQVRHNRGRTIEQVFPDSGLIYPYNTARDAQQTGPMLSTAFKVKNFDDSIDAGLVRGEPGSFVNPKLVPNMADSGRVVGGIKRTAETFIVGLVGNMRGFEQAEAAGVDAIAFMGGTPKFCEKNIGCTEQEALRRFAEIAKKAHEKGMLALYYHSGSFVCPVSNEPTPFIQVQKAAEDVFLAGADQFIACDTTGVATRKWVYALFKKLSEVVPLASRVAFHAHGASPKVFQNVKAYMDAGGRIPHGSLGQDGQGCAMLSKEKEIKSNPALEELIPYLQRLSIGVDPAISAAKVGQAAIEFENERRKK
jgi:hydroxymethylglutaryl-CoA lyase